MIKANYIIISILLAITTLLLSSCCQKITKLEAIHSITNDASNEVVIVKDTILVNSTKFDTTILFNTIHDTFNIETEKLIVKLIRKDSNFVSVLTEIKLDTVFIDKTVIRVVYPQETIVDKIAYNTNKLLPTFGIISFILVAIFGIKYYLIKN